MFINIHLQWKTAGQSAHWNRINKGISQLLTVVLTLKFQLGPNASKSQGAGGMRGGRGFTPHVHASDGATRPASPRAGPLVHTGVPSFRAGFQVPMPGPAATQPGPRSVFTRQTPRAAVPGAPCALPEPRPPSEAAHPLPGLRSGCPRPGLQGWRRQQQNDGDDERADATPPTRPPPEPAHAAPPARSPARSRSRRSRGARPASSGPAPPGVPTAPARARRRPPRRPGLWRTWRLSPARCCGWPSCCPTALSCATTRPSKCPRIRPTEGAGNS